VVFFPRKGEDKEQQREGEGEGAGGEGRIRNLAGGAG